jgi:hypothetical protein
MVFAHVVPGYFAAAKVTRGAATDWSRNQRIAIWVVALGATVLPDLDVMYNAFFRGFINHSTFWTHSVFVYLGIGMVAAILWFGFRWKFAAVLVGLIAFEGVGHIFLDVISHGSMLFYPVSVDFLGTAPRRVIVGGFWAYITDPIFLLEPFLIAIMLLHCIVTSHFSRNTKRVLIGATLGTLCAFVAGFLVFLPELQGAVLPLLKL